MKKVIFYLIENNDLFHEPSLFPHEKLACEAIIANWRNGLRIFVSCQDQDQAEKIDEYLWQQNNENFVPHNLVGEGMKTGSPVEIGWVGKRSSIRRHLLINLQLEFPDFASVYNDVIDFVPFDSDLKTLARARYIAYKNVGFNLKTITADHSLV